MKLAVYRALRAARQAKVAEALARQGEATTAHHNVDDAPTMASPTIGVAEDGAGSNGA